MRGFLFVHGKPRLTEAKLLAVIYLFCLVLGSAGDRAQGLIHMLGKQSALQPASASTAGLSADYLAQP